MLAIVVMAMSVALAVAEEPAAPQPTAEHQALEAWIGSWSGQGELKPGPFGPGGPMSWTEECSWFEGGGFHVICRSQGTGPMGATKGLGIIGYHSEKKVYTHYGVDSSGWSGYAEGARTGDTWTFQSREVMGGTSFESRAIMTMTSPSTMSFSWAVSEDGSTWTVLMDGTTTRR
jgi:hypothetical protein